MIISGDFMIISTPVLRQELQEKYKNPDTKIGRMVKNKQLFRLKRGWYETNPHTEPYYLANVLYGPSYVSFEYMLGYYDLIPEGVVWVTSATCGKGRKKEYQNHFGLYSFQDVPEVIFPFGAPFYHDGKYVYQLATPEKALCDKLYIMPVVTSQRDMLDMLVEDLRIDEEDLCNLSSPDLKFYSEHYPSRNVRLLYPTIERFLK